MRGFIHFRFIFLIVIVSLMFAAQCFWFARARRLIDKIAWPAWRHLFQGLWIAAILLLLTASLAPISSHWFPHRDLAHWMISVSRLWLLAFFLAFQAVTSVEFMDRLSRRAMLAIPLAASYRK